MKRTLFSLALLLMALPATFAIDPDVYVSHQNGKGRFVLVANQKAVPLLASTMDYPGVIQALQNLQADLKQVTKTAPLVAMDTPPADREVVLIGTLGKSPLIDQLVRTRKLDVSGLAGKWETFVTQIVEKPVPGVDRALVIAGSDKRGTVYGIYDLSAQIGVSPWNWWADVPVVQQAALYVLPGRHTQGTPAVKYRGIFINDEAPALSGWAREKFGGFNHKFYEHVFELILRMKGNYLWPAMWGSAFYDDDSLNPQLADEYGIVIGTTHHEPLMRAHDEWRRYGKGPWNYQKNDSTLRNFWRKGVQRMGTGESIVSVGMRGDGDEPMSRESNTALLERIVADQRQIIGDVTRKDPSATPQLWALYKEVQDYYDKGMRVPDDVTLLLCDDNWGNIRRLPAVGSPKRQGGYGIYYHFDYVGGPRNYKWLNTSPIARTWEQMHLAYEHGVDRIWIVNVGDIKPMEFPIEFFLDYAWSPDRWPADKLGEYTRLWAEKQFGGPKYAEAIADILTRYTQYNSRRKPELLTPDTYSLTNYREAETVVADYNQLLAKAEQVGKELPAAYQDAYFQLVIHPVKACANLNELYVTIGLNRLYAKQGRTTTNELADRARYLFEKDARITRYYNDTLTGGKWRHLMDQTHIGYTTWQQPDKNVMPDVTTLTLPTAASMGVAIDGSDAWWPASTTEAVLPEFSPSSPVKPYIDVFNRGSQSFAYSVETGVPWLRVTTPAGTVTSQQRLELLIDWAHVPAGAQRVPITITGPDNQRVVVQAVVTNQPDFIYAYRERNGYIALVPGKFSRMTGAEGSHWQRIPDIGRTGAGMTLFPVTTAAPNGLTAGSPRLEFTVELAREGTITVQTYLSPTLNFNADKGLHYGISFDDETPQLIAMPTEQAGKSWEKSVADNIRVLSSQHQLTKPGRHTLKFWAVDPGVVLQKIVIDCEGVQPSYLGPPEPVFRSAGSGERTRASAGK